MTRPRKRSLRLTLRSSLGLTAMVGALAFAASVQAQEAARTTATAATTTTTSTSTTPPLKPARPYWPELTPAQRQALAPLSEDWERLDFQTKKKWVEIANRYPKMQPDEQARTRDRMREWALLTPEQRRVARDSYARIRAMPPEQRAEILRKYQELPDEKRQALATEGRAVKPLVVPKPMPAAPVSRRLQIREGASVRNPAVAAQKSASPVAAPVQPTAPKAVPPAAAPAPPTTPTPAALPGTPATSAPAS
jgi:hypothetical protein